MTHLYDQMPSVREKRLRAQLLAEKNSELAKIKDLLNKQNIVSAP